jgi:hypothetical protein
LTAAVVGGERVEPRLEPVEAVLYALEPLRDRAEPPRHTLHVGRGRDAERAHGRLLGLDRLLARLERARQGGVHERIADQVLGQAAERLLALPRESLPQALVVFLGAHGGQRSGIQARPGRRSGRLKLRLSMRSPRQRLNRLRTRSGSRLRCPDTGSNFRMAGERSDSFRATFPAGAVLGRWGREGEKAEHG